MIAEDLFVLAIFVMGADGALICLTVKFSRDKECRDRSIAGYIEAKAHNGQRSSRWL